MAKAPTFNNEGDVKKRVKKLLDKHKWFWWMPPANGYGRTGISDIQAFRGGIFMAIETKFGKNKPTAMQRSFLASVQSEGGFAYVVNEGNIEWLEAWLAAFDRSIDATAVRKAVSPEDGAMMLNAIKAMTEDL